MDFDAFVYFGLETWHGPLDAIVPRRYFNAIAAGFIREALPDQVVLRIKNTHRRTRDGRPSLVNDGAGDNGLPTGCLKCRFVHLWGHLEAWRQRHDGPPRVERLG